MMQFLFGAHSLKDFQFRESFSHVGCLFRFGCMWANGMIRPDNGTKIPWRPCQLQHSPDWPSASRTCFLFGSLPFHRFVHRSFLQNTAIGCKVPSQVHIINPSLISQYSLQIFMANLATLTISRVPVRTKFQPRIWLPFFSNFLGVQLGLLFVQNHVFKPINSCNVLHSI